VQARVIEIDCLRATDSSRFLSFLEEGILTAFNTPTDLALIQQWSIQQPVILEQSMNTRCRLVWHPGSTDEWELFRVLLGLPQVLAEWLNCRVVILFQNFPHIRSWDRSGKWESYLRLEIQQQTRVSYALISTVAETWMQQSNIQVVLLGPLKSEDLRHWLVEMMKSQDLIFEPAALELFLEYVQGNFADAVTLARRIWQTFQTFERIGLLHSELGGISPKQSSVIQQQPTKITTIHPHQVHRSALALVEDLSITFESLLLLLPSSQVRVLESLALDPTDSPHSRDYIQKHHLSRGGGLQGALASLQQKGLVYGPEYGYQITLPMLTFWLKHRLA
jgi:hypothetical protein